MGEFVDLRATPTRGFDHGSPGHSPETEIQFTSSGERQAIEVVRRHRLWEHYLIRRADFDEDHVDRGADELEHLLPLELLDELEKELYTDRDSIPPSPHAITLPSSTDQRGRPT